MKLKVSYKNKAGKITDVWRLNKVLPVAVKSMKKSKEK